MKRLTIFFVFAGLLLWSQLSAQDFAKSFGSQKPVYQQILPDLSTKGQVILSEDFSTWPPAGWTFVNASGSPGFINGNGYAFHNDDRVDCADYMITPGISLPSNADTLILSFDSYENYSSYYVKHAVLVMDGNDPNSANILDTLFQGPTTEGVWETVSCDLTPYAGQTVYIAFYYEGNYADEWSIDNVIVFSPDSLDLTPVVVLPTNFVPYTALKTVYLSYKNFGYSTFSDSVQIILNLMQDSNEVFSLDTTFVDSIGAQATHGMYFDVNVPALDPGTYVWQLIVKSSSDLDPSNDTITTNLEVSLPAYDAQYDMYGYVAFDSNGVFNDKFVNINPATGDVDSLGSNMDAPYGATFTIINNEFVMLGVVNNTIAILSPSDGQIKGIMPLRSLPDTVSIYGLAYDPTSGLFYTVGYSYSSSLGRSYNLLYSFDLSHMQANYIDSIPGVKALLAIAINSQGNIYGIDLVEDALFAVDKNNASSQNIGSLNVSISYIQDITFDWATNTLYGALFYYSFFTGVDAGLYTINTSTGAATLIKDNPYEITALAYKSTPVVSLVEQTSNITVIPNPATDYLMINNIETPAKAAVIDIKGKVLFTTSINTNNQKINIANLQPGIYLLKITSAQGTQTLKFIKK